MSWTVVRWQDAAVVPWRNGGGVTRELVAWPAAGDWQWRMSVAEITADGPFSRFDGVRRWFAVLGGAGVVLRIGERAHRLDADSAPLAFDGSDEVTCVLDGGATRDFNLMVRQGDGRMLRLHGEASQPVRRGCVAALWVGDEGGEIRQAGTVLDVPPMSLAWCIAQADGKVQVRATRGLWMEVNA